MRLSARSTPDWMVTLPTRLRIRPSRQAVTHAQGLAGGLAGVRIGVDRLTRISGEAADPAIAGALDAALELLRDAGAAI